MPSTQEYANLSERVYFEPDVNKVYQEGHRPSFTLGNKKYEIYEHASNPKTGYQGTIYQDVVSKEFIVAHRGTEPPSKDIMDAKADAIMVNSRTNIQANDALALTARAQIFASQYHDKHRSENSPTVAVTGHSLGGTLAQITAHHYGLRGEAFNPYGATALDRHIPNVNGNFTNHVLAGDVVSSGAPHYGKTVVYATAQDVAAIKAHNIARHLVPGSTVITAGTLMGDHSITNFTGHDGHLNILTDPQAGIRATQQWSAIQNYRNDVAADRQLLGAALISPTGIKNVFNDLFSENTSSPSVSPINVRNSIDQSALALAKGSEYGFDASASQSLWNKANDYQDILSKPLSVTASSKEMTAYATAAFLSSDDSFLHGRLDQVANNHAFIKSMQHAENFVMAVETHQQQLQAQNQTQETSSPSRSMRM